MDNSDNSNDKNMNVGCKSIRLGILSLCVSVFFGLFGSVGLADDLSSVGFENSKSTAKINEKIKAVFSLSVFKIEKTKLTFKNKNTACTMKMGTTDCGTSGCSFDFTPTSASKTPYTYSDNLIQFGFASAPSGDVNCKYEISSVRGDTSAKAANSSAIQLKKPKISYSGDSGKRKPSPNNSIQFSVSNIVALSDLTSAEFGYSISGDDCKKIGDFTSSGSGNTITVTGQWDGAGQKCKETIQLKENSIVIAKETFDYKMAGDGGGAFSAVKLSPCTTTAVASGAARSCTVQATDGTSVLSNKMRYDIAISTSSSNCSVTPTSATIAAESSSIKNRKIELTDLKITNSQGGTCSLKFVVKQTDSTGSTTEKSTTQDFSVTAAVCTANAVTTDEAKFTEGSSTSVIATRTKTCNAAGTKLTTGNWKLK